MAILQLKNSNKFFNGALTWNDVFQSPFLDASLPNKKGEVRIYETKESIEMEILAPGLNKEDFKIEVDKGILHIESIQQDSANLVERTLIRDEFRLQDIKRSFTIDDQLDAENIKASYDKGILTLVLPKKQIQEQLPKKIAIL